MKRNTWCSRDTAMQQTKPCAPILHTDTIETLFTLMIIAHIVNYSRNSLNTTFSKKLTSQDSKSSNLMHMALWSWSSLCVLSCGDASSTVRNTRRGPSSFYRWAIVHHRAEKHLDGTVGRCGFGKYPVSWDAHMWQSLWQVRMAQRFHLIVRFRSHFWSQKTTRWAHIFIAFFQCQSL